MVRPFVGEVGCGGPAAFRVDDRSVSEDQRERIFERFVRLDATRAADDGGAGLGLAIARDVVARHGGSLVVRARPGGGALFEAALPLNRPTYVDTPYPLRVRGRPEAPIAPGQRRRGPREWEQGQIVAVSITNR
ncbi:HAMP domain-containing histidine kinase [Actinoallomurus purpureus]|uniref:ATP-binding protein n=1 Tax=Actinoallomurus purpureus TaxID=478114 RepID=UPI0020928464|nr:HAMP domain-containing sensor histidine kinase [Actinoallomurus purpureus]MCO6003456.1 HAMP domain-containing histidine kinase [Actinoallomurus purpureus]